MEGAPEMSVLIVEQADLLCLRSVLISSINNNGDDA